jgi:hypothetical protein
MKKIKSLAEAKQILRLETVFETNSCFLVNNFGKYSPNITFVLEKDFEGKSLETFSNQKTQEIIADMNLDLSGCVSVMFGDFWKSQKGGACFRPKEIKHASHVYIRISWGGAFEKSRGLRDFPKHYEYYRRASSNGGGTGFDYLVVPMGFVALRSEDGSYTDDGTLDLFVFRASEIRRSYVEYERNEKEKILREAAEKAEVQRIRKENAEKMRPVLQSRLEEFIKRFNQLEIVGQSFYLSEENFYAFGSNYDYSEENLLWVEGKLLKKEAEFNDLKNKRESAIPGLKELLPRAETLGLEIVFEKDSFRFGGQIWRYSEQSPSEIDDEISKKEISIIQSQKVAAWAIEYAEKSVEAITQGLPTDVHIWKRRGGATNAGDGWVIRQDGTFRDPDEMDCPRPRYQDEGTQIWKQVLVGEVVLKWAKAVTAAKHEFEVLCRPEVLTPAQLRAIAILEEEIAIEWDGRKGLASGIPSPPVGKGWNLA